MIYVYKVKRLINWYELQGFMPVKEGAKYVAIPSKIFLKKKAVVVMSPDGGKMLIERGQKPLAYQNFEDKWGRGTYTLLYFEWLPNLKKGEYELQTK